MKWNLDTTHSAAEFAVKHLMISTVKGRFAKLEGGGETSPNGALGSAHMTLDVASIDTNEPKRDGHLKSADFFDAEKNPKITFESKSVKKLDGERLEVLGDLSLHGVTKPVTLAARLEGRGKDPWGGDRIAFHASTTIDRGDFGLGWNQVLEAGGVLVGTKIEIEIEIQAVKKA